MRFMEKAVARTNAVTPVTATVVNKFGSFFYGSLLGVFVLAVAARWATPWGAFLGLLAGMASVATVSVSTDISFLWFNVVGAVAVVTTAAVIALIEKQLGHVSRVRVVKFLLDDLNADPEPQKRLGFDRVFPPDCNLHEVAALLRQDLGIKER